MITVVNGTNRQHNLTQIVSKYYADVLKELGADYKCFSLEQLPADFVTPEGYYNKPADMLVLEEEYLYPADKFIFVFPEYNGTFPGVLKTLFDYTAIEKAWYYKKAALTGISDGRSGNLRGIDQMTTFLHYTRVNVYPQYLPISQVKKTLNTERTTLIDEPTKAAIRSQVEGFLKF